MSEGIMMHAGRRGLKTRLIRPRSAKMWRPYINFLTLMYNKSLSKEPLQDTAPCSMA